MSTYAPFLRREVFLVCLDRRHRVALTAADPVGLPMVRRRERETYEEAVGRAFVGLIPATAVRLADLVGRVEASTPAEAGRGRGVRREARIFVGHLERGALSPAEGSCDDSVFWVPHTEVAQAVAALGIPELGDFIEGYVDGWIPDGWITLGPQGADLQ